MYRLHGFSLSNYYNLVKLTMLEKGLPFEEVQVFPPPKPEFQQKSPMGKIPCLEIDAGRFLSESQVILDYLEETHPEPALYPEDPFARAKVRELMRVMELYLELPARRLYTQAFFGGTVSDETRQQVHAQIEKAGAAFGQMARFEGHLAGGELSLADLAAVIHLPLVSLATRRIYGEDLLAPLAGLPDYLARLRQRSCVQIVLDGQKQASARLAP